MSHPDEATTIDEAVAGRPSEEAGADLPLYGADYYENDLGLPYKRDEHWMAFNGRLADNIVRSLRPATALDAGCALGFLVEALRDRGVDAKGFDVSEFAISQAYETIKAHVWQAPLTAPLDGRYDLVTMVEVIEHLPRAEAGDAIANICSVTDTVLMSSSPHDFTEATHLNVRPPEDWTVLFAQNGFIRDLDYDATFITPWAALYRRASHPDVVDVVRAYDRWHWRLAHERDELRQGIVSLKNRLEETTAATGGTSLGDLHEAVRSLRDQVIGLEAELGEAQGALTEQLALEATYRQLNERFNLNHDEYIRSREIMAEYEAIERSTVLGAVRGALKGYTQLRLKLGMGLK